jgi:hypothetical protein
MSGGQKISDHSFFGGKASKGSVFPMGVHLKAESSAEGAGDLSRYEDTTEAIKKVQVEGVRQIKARPLKEGYRH